MGVIIAMMFSNQYHVDAAGSDDWIVILLLV